jgi:PhnB protein
MNKAILFDFLVDKENKKVKVKRSFNARLPLVWQAWTDPEILDQWWAPHPWKSETLTMDFREGGKWFYAMRSPDNTETHYCLANFRTIIREELFTSDDAFCNETEQINPNFPAYHWEVQFTAMEEDTAVDVTLSFEQLEHLEQIIQMGFKEGFTQGLEQLDEWLNHQNNKK